MGEKKLFIIFGRLFPFFTIFIIIAGFSLAFILGRPDFAIRGLGIAVPAILASYISIKIHKEKNDFENTNLLFSVDKKNLVQLFGIFYAISIFINLVNPYRPVYYFIIISILYILVFIQIFSKTVRPNLVLLEIVFIMLNLIYGVTLKYPFYFGYTDIMGHIFYSEVTYFSGHVIPIDLDINYANFPIYHIIMAESSFLLGLDIRTSVFIITGLIYVTLIVFLYYIFNQFIHNRQVSLLTCLLFSVSSVVVFYGTYMITRSMAFVGFIILLYLIYIDKVDTNKILFRFLAIIFCIFLILVHQVSIVQIIIILFILFMCEFAVFNKIYRGNLFILLNVLFLAYWFYIALIFTNNVIYTHSRPDDFENVIVKPTIKKGNELSFLADNIDSFVFLFFALIGIGYNLWKGKPKYATVFSLFALITLLLYIPNPLQTLWQTMTLLRFDRFKLLISPFMALVMAVGIHILYRYLIKDNSSIIYKIIIISLFTIFVFTSLLSNSSDSKDMQFNSPRMYFNDEELEGFNYVLNHISFGSVLYSDYYTERFFIQEKFNGSNALNLPYYNSNKINDVNYISTYNGYIIIRQKEFSDAGLYFGLESYNYIYSSTDENRLQLTNNLEKRNKIFSNSAVDIFYSGNYEK